MAIRNYGKHTSSDVAKINILQLLDRLPSSYLASKSQLGYAAFPDYKFKWPQGAAFSVAKIVSEMERDKLIYWTSREFNRGYGIANAGEKLLKQLKG